MLQLLNGFKNDQNVFIKGQLSLSEQIFGLRSCRIISSQTLQMRERQITRLAVPIDALIPLHVFSGCLSECVCVCVSVCVLAVVGTDSMPDRPSWQ